MNKLTPCRKVGLSRTKKKFKHKSPKTELKLVENVSEDPKTTPGLNKSLTSNPLLSKKRGELNTPCRSVGLPRKRKLSGSSKKSSSRREKSVESSKKRINTNDISPDTPINSKGLGENLTDKLTNCSKKLLNQFSSDSPKVVVETKSSESIFGDEVVNAEVEEVLDQDEIEEPPQETEKCNQFIKVCYETHEDTTQDLKKHQILEKGSGILNGNGSQETAKSNQFIKVCYDTLEDTPQDLTKCKISKNDCGILNENNGIVHSQKNDKTRKKIVEDDDFENSPKLKKTKTTFKRFETDVQLHESKSKKKKLKKSLSVGDTEFETTNSKDSKSKCFIKLERLDITKKPKVKTIECLSDDDFDLTPTPPSRDKLKININKLEKEVEEKRKLLEDLERAKIYRRMHDVETLKQLTFKWKRGCEAALKDLLMQLRSHGEIDLETLLKKLDIPKEMILSQ